MKRKLTLRTESIRNLSPAELGSVAGGAGDPALSKVACTNTCYACDIATVQSDPGPKAPS